MEAGLGATSLRENTHPDDPGDLGPELRSNFSATTDRALKAKDPNNSYSSYGMDAVLERDDWDHRHYIKDKSPRHPLNQRRLPPSSPPDDAERPFVPIHSCSKCHKELGPQLRWCCYKAGCGMTYCYDCAGKPPSDNLGVACLHWNTPGMTMMVEPTPVSRTADGIAEDNPETTDRMVQQHERWLEEGQRLVREGASWTTFCKRYIPWVPADWLEKRHGGETMEGITPEGRPGAKYMPDSGARHNTAMTWSDMWKAEQGQTPAPECLICGANNVTGSRCRCGRWTGRLPMNVRSAPEAVVNRENVEGTAETEADREDSVGVAETDAAIEF